mgnify:CR=1 FL=1
MRPATASLIGLVLLACGPGCGDAPARPAARAVSAPPPAAAGAAPASGAAGPVVAGRPREISFDDIKLDMQKGDPFTPSG